MAIKKMKLVRLSGPKNKLDKVISRCLALGSFQTENASQYISGSMGYSELNEESPFSARISSVEELSKSFDFNLEPKEKKKTKKIDESQVEYITSLSEKLSLLAKSRAELKLQETQCTDAISKLEHFSSLSVSFDDIFSLKYITVRFGHLPRESKLKLDSGSLSSSFFFWQAGEDETGVFGAYFTPKDKEDEADSIFAALRFELLDIPQTSGTPGEVILSLNDNLKIISEQQKQIDEEIAQTFETEGDRIRSIYHKLQDLELIFEQKKLAAYHNNSCFFVGWIPENDEEKLREKMKAIPEFLMEVESPNKNKKLNPPTLLKNLRVFRPFEYFVEMYGLPGYNEIDITAFVAITYTILFGMMFGDLGQGICLLLIGLVMWKKKGMPLGKILIPCGISASLFGLVYGSVFGLEDVLDGLYHKIGLAHKPLSVMDSINTVLLFAIGIGVALVCVALILGIVSSIKKGKVGTALFSENGLVGLVTYLGICALVYRFMLKKSIIPTPLAVVMMVGGLVLLFFKEIIAKSIDEKKFAKPESMSDFLMQNVFEVIEYVLSYFSNTVSFLRVGAFVIVHASMMMVVATLAGDPNTAKGLVVYVLGNALVIVLEALLSGIQCLRLEFYEMFSRFYDGNGIKYHATTFRKNKKLDK